MAVSITQLVGVVILDLLICVYYSDTHLESRKGYFDPLRVDSAAMHLIYDDENTSTTNGGESSRRGSVSQLQARYLLN